MKKTFAILMVVLGACIIALAVAHFSMLDGLDGMVFRQWFPETTEYASGYSDSAFRHVASGMTSQQVVKLLGPPLDQFDVSSRPDDLTITTWRYSRSTNDSHFTMRLVQFQDGAVMRKVSEYYVD
jgi:hypothetical protein